MAATLWHWTYNVDYLYIGVFASLLGIWACIWSVCRKSVAGMRMMEDQLEVLGNLLLQSSLPGPFTYARNFPDHCRNTTNSSMKHFWHCFRSTPCASIYHESGILFPILENTLLMFKFTFLPNNFHRFTKKCVFWPLEIILYFVVFTERDTLPEGWPHGWAAVLLFA